MALSQHIKNPIAAPSSVGPENTTSPGMVVEDDGDNINTGTVLEIVIPIVVLIILVGVLVFAFHRLKMSGIYPCACCNVALAYLPCCCWDADVDIDCPPPPPPLLYSEIANDPRPPNVPERSSLRRPNRNILLPPPPPPPPPSNIAFISVPENLPERSSPRPRKSGGSKNEVHPESIPLPSNQDTLPTPSFVVEAAEGTEPPPSTPSKDSPLTEGDGGSDDPHRTARRFYGDSPIEQYNYSDNVAHQVGRQLFRDSPVERNYHSDVDQPDGNWRSRRRKKKTERTRSSASSRRLAHRQGQEREEQEKEEEEDEEEEEEEPEAVGGETPRSRREKSLLDRGGDAKPRSKSYEGRHGRAESGQKRSRAHHSESSIISSSHEGQRPDSPEYVNV